MNKYSALIAVAAFAALASTGVRAQDGEAATGQFATQIESTRTRAEVRAEATEAARARTTDAASSYVAAAPVKSAVNTRAVRAQAGQAQRLGQIGNGEVNF